MPPPAFRGKHRPFRLIGDAAVPPADKAAGPASERGPGSEAAIEAAHSLAYCRDGVLRLAGDPPTDTGNGSNGSSNSNSSSGSDGGGASHRHG